MENVNILVVTDAQVDFESGALGTPEAQAAVPAIIRKITECGNAGYVVVATKDTHGADYLQTSEGQNLPVKHTIFGEPGWQFIPGIRETLKSYNAVTVLKNTFGCTELAGVVKLIARTGEDIGTGKDLRIEIIGFCTDICVISNALLLKAAFPDAEIIVDPECCAGVTPELHKAALDVMASCQIGIMTKEEEQA